MQPGPVGRVAISAAKKSFMVCSVKLYKSPQMKKTSSIVPVSSAEKERKVWRDKRGGFQTFQP